MGARRAPGDDAAHQLRASPQLFAARRCARCMLQWALTRALPLARISTQRQRGAVVFGVFNASAGDAHAPGVPLLRSLSCPRTSH